MRYQDPLKRGRGERRQFPFGDKAQDTECGIDWWASTTLFRVTHNSDTPLKQLAKELKLFCGGFKHESHGKKLSDFDLPIPGLDHGSTYSYRLLRFAKAKDYTKKTGWKYIVAFLDRHPEFAAATLREGCNWLRSFSRTIPLAHEVTFAGSVIVTTPRKIYIPYATFGTGRGALLCTNTFGGHFEMSDAFLVRIQHL